MARHNGGWFKAWRGCMGLPLVKPKAEIEDDVK